jgi:tetratricopeptide (TPR) repeat protein
MVVAGSERGAVSRQIAPAALVFVAALLFGGAAGAETVPGSGSLGSQELSRRAIECLERGENAADPKQQRAAYEEGLALARRSVEADDTNPDGHFAIFANQGRLMLLDGVTVNPASLYRASRELERTLELDPLHADALAAKGGLYRQLPWFLGGNLDKAENLLTQAIELNPNAINARIELAATYRDMGQPERGLPFLEKAVVIADRAGRHRQLALARALLREIRSHP